MQSTRHDDRRIDHSALGIQGHVIAGALVVGFFALAGWVSRNGPVEAAQMLFSVPMVDEATVLAIAPPSDPPTPQQATGVVAATASQDAAQATNAAPDAAVIEFEALDPVGAGHPAP